MATTSKPLSMDVPILSGAGATAAPINETLRVNPRVVGRTVVVDTAAATGRRDATPARATTHRVASAAIV
ncbi:hypothetical protein N9L76_01715 [bacterium]|nr:hypothetical protein [bacterium]